MKGKPMADTSSQQSAAKTAKQKSAPFKPAGTVFQGKEVDFAGLAPQTESEPAIVQGIDPAGQTKIVFAAQPAVSRSPDTLTECRNTGSRLAG